MKTFWDKGPSKTVRTILFLVVGCGIPALIVGPFLQVAMKSSTAQMDSRFGSICLSRLGQVGKAMHMYAEDNDQHYPYANAWIDGTWKYILKKDPKETTENPFQCPTIAQLRTGEFGFAMNEAFDAKPLQEESKDPLIFDSDELGRNAHATLGSLALPPRHNDHTFNNALYPNLTAKRIPTEADSNESTRTPKK